MSDKASNQQLLPCPFCGASAAFFDTEEGENADGKWIQCTDCGVSSMIRFPLKEGVHDMLIEAWNRRVAVPETPAECPGHYKVAARNVCTMFPHCLCSPEARAAEATEDARHQKATCGWGGAYGLCVLEPDHDGPHEIPRHPKTGDVG